VRTGVYYTQLRNVEGGDKIRASVQVVIPKNLRASMDPGLHGNGDDEARSNNHLIIVEFIDFKS